MSPEEEEISEDMRLSAQWMYREHSWSPLMIAIWEKRDSDALALIDRGADVNHADKFGRTALHIVANAVPEKSEEDSQLTIITALLQNGATIDAQEIDGLTPMMNSAYRRNKKVVRLLLQNRANPNAKDKSGDTFICGVRKSSPTTQKYFATTIKIVKDFGGIDPSTSPNTTESHQ